MLSIALWTALFVLAQTQQTSPPDDELRAARQLIGSNQLADAEKLARRYLAAKPESAAAHYLLGYILFREGDPQRSLEQYTEAARFRRPDAFDLEVVGSNYVLLHDYADADKWFTKAVEWNPANVRVRYYLGRAKYNENRFEEAISVFNACLKLDPKNVKAQDNLALSLEGLGRADEAEAAYRKAIGWDQAAATHNAQPYLDLGTLLVNRDRSEDALPFLQRAAALAPSDAGAHRELGKAYLHVSRMSDARAELETAVSQDPGNHPTHFILGQVYRRLGLVAEARRENELYAEQPPAGVQQLEQAAASIEHGDLASAEVSLQRVLKQDPDDALALNLLGVIRVQENKPAEAEKLFLRAIDTGHPIAGPRINLAKLYAHDQPLDAMTQLEKALDAAPDNDQAKSLLREVAQRAALAASRSGDNHGSLEILDRALHTLPRDPKLLCDIGTVHLQLGDYAQAAQSFQAALEVDPKLADGRVGLARAYLKQSKAGEAEAEMRRYLQDRPDDPSAHYGLGYVLMSEQKADAAETEFELSLRLEPRQTESRYQLGEIALQKSNPKLAFQQFTAVVSANPHHGGALTGLAILSFRDARYDDARRYCEQAVAAAPDYQKAHYYLALSLAKLGRKSDAEHELDRSRQLQSQHAETLTLP